MQLISKFNEGFQFLSRFIDIYSKHAWIAPLKDKKVITIQKNLDDSNRKRNKIKVSNFTIE